MLNGLNNIVNFLNGYIWGVGMLVLIVGSGLYFTELLTNRILTREFRHSVRSVRLWQCVSVQVT